MGLYGSAVHGLLILKGNNQLTTIAKAELWAYVMGPFKIETYVKDSYPPMDQICIPSIEKT